MMETSKVIWAYPKSGSRHLESLMGHERRLWRDAETFVATKFVKWAGWKAGKAEW